MKNMLVTVALLLSSSVAVADVRSDLRAPMKSTAVNPSNATVLEKPSLRDRLPLKARRLNWVPLTAPAQVSGEATFNIGQASQFSEIQVRALHGLSFIRTVVVDFGDGNTQTHEVSKVLMQGQTVSLDLGSSRHIKRIVVSGSTPQLAMFRLLGR